MSKKIIEENKNPQSRHIIQLYPDNYGQTSYHASTKKVMKDTKGISSTLLTKQEALEIIDNLLKINAPSEKDPTYQNYGQYFQGLANAMGAHRYIDESVDVVVPFEEIVEKITKSSDTISVIQYTDGWMDKGKPEEMDQSFAEWAKKRAKTFMSVVNRNQVTDNDTNSTRSIEQMKELGHPNIYDMTGKDKSIVDAEVVKQFMETATVKLHYLYEKKPADKKVYSLTFKVLNALTNEQIDQDILVAKGFSGDDYDIKAPTVDGFEVTLKEGEEKGKFAENDLLLTYLAHEKGEEVKAIFVNEKGEEIKNSEVISKAGELVGKDWKFDRDVETEITVKDTTYVLKAVPEELEGKVSSDKQTLKFVYKEKEKPAEPKKEEPKKLPKTSAVKDVLNR